MPVTRQHKHHEATMMICIMHTTVTHLLGIADYMGFKYFRLSLGNRKHIRCAELCGICKCCNYGGHLLDVWAMRKHFTFKWNIRETMRSITLVLCCLLAQPTSTDSFISESNFTLYAFTSISYGVSCETDEACLMIVIDERFKSCFLATCCNASVSAKNIQN
jgi:hypothetical protein